MGNTNADGIWTPDEDDTMEPEVWSAMMADSISGGLGKRMKLQETQTSLRATTPVPFTITGTSFSDGNAYKQVPLEIAYDAGARFPDPDYSGGNHASGIELAGNYAKIVTPGLYTLSAQATFRAEGSAHSFDFFMRVNGNVASLPDYGVTSMNAYVGAHASDTRVLAKGDMVELYAGVGTDHTGSVTVHNALLTIAMHYALPTEAIPGL